MTPREFVKSKFPRAICERYKGRGLSKGHNIVWSKFGSNSVRLGTGNDSTEAWENAKKNITKKENETV